MRAVIQRVKSAKVTINNNEIREIGNGLLILLGIKQGDTSDECDKLASKCAGLRIFDDENGNLNLSTEQVGGEIMVVSNFTLHAQTKKGNRPSFIDAAKPPLSTELYERFVQNIKRSEIKNVATGEFGADMQIELVNDGPVTIIIDTDEWRRL